MNSRSRAYGLRDFFYNRMSLSAAVPSERNEAEPQGVPMMDEAQIPMFVDDLNEAIRATVNALGGMKAVGADLKPEKSAVDAGKWLADCLNTSKRDRLDPDQLAFIRRRARAAGCHILAAFEAQDAGYAPPQPIAPEDEAAQLQREFIASVKALQDIQNKLARNGLRSAA